MEENTIIDEDFIKNTTTTITIFGENALKTAPNIFHMEKEILLHEKILSEL